MPTSKVKKNGELLSVVAEWFDKHAQQSLQDIADTRTDRARIVRGLHKETIPEKAKYHLQQMVNTGKFGVAEMFKYLTKMANAGLVDNVILRKLEKGYADLKQNDIKFIDWIKRHPSLLSYVSYYMVIAALSLATFGAVKDKSPRDKKEAPKKEIVVSPKATPVPQDTLVVNNVQKMYDVQDAKFVTKFVNENWNDIVACLAEFETFYEKTAPQSHSSRRVYGPGLTWVYERLANGTIKQHECKGEWARKAEKFSVAEIWDQVYMHLVYQSEVMSRIKIRCQKNGIDTLTSNQVLALLIAGYQIPSHAEGILDALVKAGDNEQKQMDAFQFYKSPAKTFHKGTMKRRWWCAGLYTGEISVQDIYGLQMDVFSAVKLNKVLKNNHFQFNDDVVKYCLGLENEQLVVEDYMQEHNLFAAKKEVKKVAKPAQKGNAKSDKFAQATSKVKHKATGKKRTFFAALVSNNRQA